MHARVGDQGAEARGEVRDALRRIDFEREHGTLATGQTVDGVIATSLGMQEQFAGSVLQYVRAVEQAS